jgi:hypothetical protein
MTFFSSAVMGGWSACPTVPAGFNAMGQLLVGVELAFCEANNPTFYQGSDPHLTAGQPGLTDWVFTLVFDSSMRNSRHK